MKLFNSIALLACTIASVYASGGEANNEMTYYGCPEECSTQRRPSCPHFNDDNLPSHFAALSTSLSHYEDYCGHYAVYMMADGSRSDKLAKAVVVDSCGSCAKYHLDLSKTAFGELRQHSKGTGKIIWGIYSKNGERLGGPWYSSVSGASKDLGMSEDSFISAFDANAKKLASSSSNSATFSSSGRSSDYNRNNNNNDNDNDDDDDNDYHHYTSKKTTSRKTTIRRTTTRYNNNNFPPKRVNTKTLPVGGYSRGGYSNSGSYSNSGYSHGGYSNSGSYSNNGYSHGGYSNQGGYSSSKTIPINVGGYSNSKTLPLNQNYSGGFKTLPVNAGFNTNSKTLPINAGFNTNSKTLPVFGNPNNLPAKTLPINAGFNAGTKTLPAFGNPDALPAKTLPINNQATTTNEAPSQTSTPTPSPSNDNKEKEAKKNDNNIGTTIGILAIGGGCIGAAGAGLLFMKKKNPSTYEDLKQKFPEAFSTVKRSLSRKTSSSKGNNYTRELPNEGRYQPSNNVRYEPLSNERYGIPSDKRYKSLDDENYESLIDGRYYV